MPTTTATSPQQRVDALDLSLFSTVPSQTSDPEKRSLLAVQRAVARSFGSYRYVEIGSHLGGSLQPHVIDPRCVAIHSIDLRPQAAPDDRGKEFVKLFKDNSTAKMLENLKAVDAQGIAKIRTYDMDSKDVPRSSFTEKVQLAFIDGEHTRAAVIRDHELCYSALADGGVILYHDLYIVFPGLMDIMAALRAKGIHFRPVKLERSIFGLFFDPAIIEQDDFLRECAARNQGELDRLTRRQRLKRMAPGFVRRFFETSN